MSTTPRKPKLDPCRAQKIAVGRRQAAVDLTESKLKADPAEPLKHQLEQQLEQQNLALTAARNALIACERTHGGSKKKTVKKKGAPKKKAKKR
jgi:hypothetical protein